MAWYQWGTTAVRAVQWNNWTAQWPLWFYRLPRAVREISPQRWVCEVTTPNDILTLQVGDWFIWAGGERYRVLADLDFRDSYRGLSEVKGPASGLDQLTDGTNPVMGIDLATGMGLVADEQGRVAPAVAGNHDSWVGNTRARISDWLSRYDEDLLLYGNPFMRIDPRRVQVPQQPTKPVKVPYVPPEEKPPRTLLF